MEDYSDKKKKKKRKSKKIYQSSKGKLREKKITRVLKKSFTKRKTEKKKLC